MKKLFAVLAISALFTACNSGTTETETTTTDTTIEEVVPVAPIDSMAVDTTVTPVDTPAAE